jgi:hypothetical protein
LRQKQVQASLNLPAAAISAKIHLRLRVPEGRHIQSVTVNGSPWKDFDPVSETVTLAAGASGKKQVVVKY